MITRWKNKIIVLINVNSFCTYFVHKANTAPIVTIHSSVCHPNCWYMCRKGVSGSLYKRKIKLTLKP